MRISVILDIKTNFVIEDTGYTRNYRSIYSGGGANCELD